MFIYSICSMFEMSWDFIRLYDCFDLFIEEFMLKSWMFKVLSGELKFVEVIMEARMGAGMSGPFWFGKDRPVSGNS